MYRPSKYLMGPPVVKMSTAVRVAFCNVSEAKFLHCGNVGQGKGIQTDNDLNVKQIKSSRTSPKIEIKGCQSANNANFNLNSRPYPWPILKPSPLFAYKPSARLDSQLIKIVHFSTTLSKDCENENDADSEKVAIDPAKERTKIIPVEISMKYMESEAYKSAYGDEPVYVKYRRNFKGQFAPKKMRKTCIRNGKNVIGNLCPLCRDEYLVVDYRNVALLKQFVSPYTEQVLPWSKTNICLRQQSKVEVAVEKARQHGLLTFYIPFREYNYEDYFDFAMNQSKS